MSLDINNLFTVGDRLECVRLLTKHSKNRFFKLLKTTRYTYENVRIGKELIPLEWAYTLQEILHVNIRWIKDGSGDIFSKTLDQSLLEGVVQWKK